MKKRSLGICLGASNIKVVELVQDESGVSVARSIVRGHESNPREVFTGLLRELDIDLYDYGMLTGRKFRDIVNANSITEPEAVEFALDFSRKNNPDAPACPAIASLGAENFLVYILNKDGTIATVETGN